MRRIVFVVGSRAAAAKGAGRETQNHDSSSSSSGVLAELPCRTTLAQRRSPFCPRDVQRNANRGGRGTQADSASRCLYERDRTKMGAQAMTTSDSQLDAIGRECHLYWDTCAESYKETFKTVIGRAIENGILIPRDEALRLPCGHERKFLKAGATSCSTQFP